MQKQTSGMNTPVSDENHAGEHDQGHVSVRGRGQGRGEGKGSGPIFPVRSDPEPEPKGNKHK